MKRVILALALVLLCGVVNAQDIELRGKIVDATTGEPLPFSIVKITDENDSMLFEAFVSNEDGTFSFVWKEALNAGNVLLTIRHMGYEAFSIQANSGQVGSEVDLGTVSLKTGSYEIDGVVVSGATVTQAVDRTTYLITSDLRKDVAVNIDLFRKIPELSVNYISRSVSIMGKSKTLILLNGVNTGESLDIRTINHEDIEKIEVIQVPSSGTEIEYDGIINIVLKSKAEKSFAIDVEETLSANLKSNDSYIGLIFGGEKVRTRLSYGNYYRRYPADLKEIRTDKESGLSYATEGRMKPKEFDHEINFSLDYYISSKDFFNFSSRMYLWDSDSRTNLKAYNILDGQTIELPDFTTKKKSKYTIGNYTAFYRRTLKKESDYFSLNANFNFQNTDNDTDSYYSNNETFLNHEKGNKIAGNLKAEYNNKINDVLTLNAGVQGYYQHFKSRVNDVVSDNNFDNYRYNAHTDLYLQLGESYQMTVGVKGEFNINDFKNPEYKTTRQAIFQPQFVVMKRLNQNSNLRLNYNRRSTYPSAWLLAPYEIESDDKTISKGNPKLKPVTYDYVGATYSYSKGAFSIYPTLYYWRGSKLITPSYSYNSELNTIQMPVNRGNYNRVAATINGSITIFKFIYFEPSVSFYYENFDMPSGTRHNRAFLFSGNIYVGLPAGFAVGGMGSYTSKLLTALGHRMDLSDLDNVFLMKNFEKIGLTAIVGYKNLIEPKTRAHIFTETYSQYNYSKYKVKGFMFRLNYHFKTGRRAEMKNIPTLYESDRKE